MSNAVLLQLLCYVPSYHVWACTSLVHNNNVAACLAACGSMQLFTAPRTLPLLGTPTVISWDINSNGLLALAFCTLHESDAQLMPSWFSWPLPTTIGVSQHPLHQLFAAPAENPAVHQHFSKTGLHCMQNKSKEHMVSLCSKLCGRLSHAKLMPATIGGCAGQNNMILLPLAIR